MVQTEKIGIVTGIVGQSIFIGAILYFSFTFKLITTFSSLFDSTILLIVLELLISFILLSSSLTLATKGLGSLIHVWSLSLGTNVLNIHVVFLEGLMGVPFIFLVFPFLISLLTTAFSTFQFLILSSSEQEAGASLGAEAAEAAEAPRTDLGSQDRQDLQVDTAEEPVTQEATSEEKKKEKKETKQKEATEPQLKRGDITAEEVRDALELTQLRDLLDQITETEETINTIKFSLREMTDQERKIRDRLAEEIEISLDEIFEKRGITRIPVEKAARALGFPADQFSAFENIVSYLEKGEFTKYELSQGFIRKKE